MNDHEPDTAVEPEPKSPVAVETPPEKQPAPKPSGPGLRQRALGNQAVLQREEQEEEPEPDSLQSTQGNQAVLQRKAAAPAAKQEKKEIPKPTGKGGEKETPKAAGGADKDAPGEGKGKDKGRGKGGAEKPPPAKGITAPEPSADVDLPEPLTPGPAMPGSGPALGGAPPTAVQARAEADTQIDLLVQRGENYKTRLRARSEAVKASMQEGSVKQRTKALAAVTEIEASIGGELRKLRAYIATQAKAQAAVARAQAIMGWTQIVAASGAQVGLLRKSAKDHQDAARQVVAGRQERARNLGITEGKRGFDAITAQSQEATRRGSQKVAGYPRDERGQMQRNAVLAVSTKAATELLKPAAKIQQDAIEQGQHLAEGFADAADATVKGIAEQAAPVELELSKSANDQLPAFAKIGETTATAIGRFAQEVNGQLDALELETRHNLQGIRRDLGRQFDLALFLGQLAVDGETALMERAVDRIVAKATGTIRGLKRPDPAAIKRAVAGLNDMLGELTQRFEDGLIELEQRATFSYTEAATAASASLARLGASVSGRLAEISHGVTGGLVAMIAKQLEEQGKILETWKAGLAEAQRVVDTQWDQMVKTVGDHLDELLQKGKPEIVKCIDDSVAKNREPLDALDEKMEEAAEEARYKYDHPIRYKLKRAFWAALKAIGMLLLVIGLVFIALVLMVFGVLSGMIGFFIAGLILLVLVVGYVVYGIIANIVHRIASATNVFDGIRGFFIGILDITGIPNIVEGIIDMDLVNGRTLTLEESGDRLGGGTIALLTIIIPFAKGIKGARGVRVPLEIPPEAVPLPPVEAPIVDVPVGRAPVEAPVVEAPVGKAPVEAPVGEGVKPPVSDAPPPEAPVAKPPPETPPVEAPAPETPKVEPPKAPKAETPNVEPSKPPTAEPAKAEPAKPEPAEPEPAEPSTAEKSQGEPPTAEPSTGKAGPPEAAPEPTVAEKVVEAEKGESGGRLEAKSLAEVKQLRKSGPKVRSAPKDLAPLGKKLWREYVEYYRERLKAIEKDLKAGKTPKDPGPLPWEAYYRFRARFQLAMEFQHEMTASLERSRGDLTIREEVAVESAAKEKINIERRSKIEAGEESTRPAPDRADQMGIDSTQLAEYQSGKRVTPPEAEAFSNKRRNPSEYPGKDALAKEDALVKQAELDGAEAITKYGGDVKIESAKFDGTPPASRSLVGAKVPVRKVTVVYDGTLIKSPALRARIRAAVREGSGFKVEAVFSDEVGPATSR